MALGAQPMFTDRKARNYTYATLVLKGCYTTQPIEVSDALRLVAGLENPPTVENNTLFCDVDNIRISMPGWELVLFFSEEMDSEELAAEWGDALAAEQKQIGNYHKGLE